MVIRCGLKFHVVCVEVGEAVHPTNVLNHWGVDVRSKEEVDAAHKAANAMKDKYGIRQVLPVQNMHGVYSFYMEDCDHNWWEIQYYDGYQHDDMYDFGDRFSMDDGVDVRSLKELEIKTSG
jgi:predicted lactoylglutathione lyase